MAGKTDELYRLFTKREDAFKDNTLELFAAAPHITTGIIDYLDLPIEEIEWDSIDIVGNEMIILVTIPLADRFQHAYPGEALIQTLSIALPVSVIDVCDADLITEYLFDTEDVRKHDERQEALQEKQYGIIGYTNGAKRTLH